MKIVGSLIKIAVSSAAESAITGASCALAMAGVSTILFWGERKKLLKDIDGKSFGPYAGQTSKSLKRWKNTKAKTKTRRVIKKAISPVVDSTVMYFEGMERGLSYLYSNTDILKPTRAILGVK